MKLNNFPSVNYTSLRESVKRRDYMHEQFDRLGISKTNVYLTDRYTDISDYVECTGKYIDNVTKQLGTIISHLNLMRNWYVSCNEPYAIFCEDDISFESINYWNFTWDDFVGNLPPDWKCVQLMRMTSTYTDPEQIKNDLKLTLRAGRWWGSHSLMKRDYVKSILDRHCIGFNQYKLEVGDYMPIIENVLFMGICPVVYNFPMLIGNVSLDTTVHVESDIHNLILNKFTSDFNAILTEWKNIDSTFNIKKILSNPS